MLVVGGVCTSRVVVCFCRCRFEWSASVGFMMGLDWDLWFEDLLVFAVC